MWGLLLLHVLTNAFFLIITTLVGVQWRFIVVLISFSVMVNNVEFLVTCLWVIVDLFQRNVSSNILPTFELSFYCWVLRILCMFWMQVPHQTFALQMFSPFCGLSFHSIIITLKHRSFQVSYSPSYLCFSFVTCDWGHIWETIAYPTVMKIYSCVFF